MFVCFCVLFILGVFDFLDEFYFSYVCFVENEVGVMD